MARRAVAARKRIAAVRQAGVTKRWGDKKTSVEISDQTGILIGKAFENVYPGIVEEFEVVTKEVYDISFDNWLEKTGYSKNKLSYAMFFTETSIEGKVFASADYSKYIHKPRPLDSVYIWQEYMIKPQKERVKPLTEKLANRMPKDMVGNG